MPPIQKLIAQEPNRSRVKTNRFISCALSRLFFYDCCLGFGYAIIVLNALNYKLWALSYFLTSFNSLLNIFIVIYRLVFVFKSQWMMEHRNRKIFEG